MVQVWVDSGLLRGLTRTVLRVSVYSHKSFFFFFFFYISHSEGGWCYCYYPYHSFASGQTTGGSAAPQSVENWIKHFLSMASPTRTRCSFPHCQSLPSESFHKPLISIRQSANHSHRKLTKLITWITAISNSMKISIMLWRAIWEGLGVVESSDNMWAMGKGNGKPSQYSPWGLHELCEKTKICGTER